MMTKKDMATSEQIVFLKNIGFDVEGMGLTESACDSLISFLGF